MVKRGDPQDYVDAEALVFEYLGNERNDSYKRGSLFHDYDYLLIHNVKASSQDLEAYYRRFHHTGCSLGQCAFEKLVDLIQRDLSRSQEVIFLFKTRIGAFPNETKTFHRMYDYIVSQSQLKEADELLQERAVSHPLSGDWTLMRFKLLTEKLKNFDLAEKFLREAIVRETSSNSFLLHRSFEYLVKLLVENKKDFDAAEQELENWISIIAERSRAHSDAKKKLVFLLINQKQDYLKVVTILREILQEFPTDVWAHSQLENVLVLMKNTPLLRDYYLEQYPSRPGYCFDKLDQLYRVSSIGGIESREQFYRGILEQEPEHYLAFRYLIHLLLQDRKDVLAAEAAYIQRLRYSERGLPLTVIDGYADFLLNRKQDYRAVEDVYRIWLESDTTAIPIFSRLFSLLHQQNPREHSALLSLYAQRLAVRPDERVFEHFLQFLQDTPHESDACFTTFLSMFTTALEGRGKISHSFFSKTIQYLIKAEHFQHAVSLYELRLRKKPSITVCRDMLWVFGTDVVPIQYQLGPLQSILKDIPALHDILFSHIFHLLTQSQDKSGLREFCHSQLDLFPGKRHILFSYLSLLLKDTDYSTAVKLLLQWQARHPQDLEAFLALGRAYSSMDAFVEAEAHYRMGALYFIEDGSLIPAFEALINFILDVKKAYEDAVQLVRQFSASHRAHPQLQAFLINIFTKTSGCIPIESWVLELSHIISPQPSISEADLFMFIACNLHDAQRALEILSPLHFLSGFPSRKLLLIEAMIYEFKMCDSEKALHFYQRALATDLAAQKKGNHHQLLPVHRDILVELECGVKSVLADAIVHENIVQDLIAAEQYYRDSLKSSHPLIGMGIAYFEYDMFLISDRSDVQGAMNIWNTACHLDPGLGKARLHLAKLILHSESPNNSIVRSHLDAVLLINPGCTDARSLLAEIDKSS